MIQLPELIDENSKIYQEGYKTICDIGQERIKRAGIKIKAETNADIDYGFKVFKLDTSNLKLWGCSSLDITTANQYFYEHIDPIVEGRTNQDILYEILLKEGIPLSTTIKEKIVNDKKIYFVTTNNIAICLEDNIDMHLVNAIGEQNPEIVIFKDSGFLDENIKVNAIQELKKHKIDESNIKTL
jgi:adenine-specific DNA-methyltransferase